MKQSKTEKITQEHENETEFLRAYLLRLRQDFEAKQKGGASAHDSAPADKKGKAINTQKMGQKGIIAPQIPSTSGQQNIIINLGGGQASESTETTSEEVINRLQDEIEMVKQEDEYLFKKQKEDYEQVIAKLKEEHLKQVNIMNDEWKSKIKQRDIIQDELVEELELLQQEAGHRPGERLKQLEKKAQQLQEANEQLIQQSKYAGSQGHYTTAMQGGQADQLLTSIIANQDSEIALLKKFYESDSSQQGNRLYDVLQSFAAALESSKDKLATAQKLNSAFAQLLRHETPVKGGNKSETSSSTMEEQLQSQKLLIYSLLNELDLLKRFQTLDHPLLPQEMKQFQTEIKRVEPNDIRMQDIPKLNTNNSIETYIDLAQKFRRQALFLSQENQELKKLLALYQKPQANKDTKTQTSNLNTQNSSSEQESQNNVEALKAQIINLKWQLSRVWGSQSSRAQKAFDIQSAMKSIRHLAEEVQDFTEIKNQLANTTLILQEKVTDNELLAKRFKEMEEKFTDILSNQAKKDAQLQKAVLQLQIKERECEGFREDLAGLPSSHNKKDYLKMFAEQREKISEQAQTIRKLAEEKELLQKTVQKISIELKNKILQGQEINSQCLALKAALKNQQELQTTLITQQAGTQVQSETVKQLNTLLLAKDQQILQLAGQLSGHTNALEMNNKQNENLKLLHEQLQAGYRQNNEANYKIQNLEKELNEARKMQQSIVTKESEINSALREF